jgi:hypothetical protein
MRNAYGYATVFKCNIDNNKHNVKNIFTAAKVLGTYLQTHTVNYSRTAKGFKYSTIKEKSIIYKYN